MRAGFGHTRYRIPQKSCGISQNQAHPSLVSEGLLHLAGHHRLYPVYAYEYGADVLNAVDLTQKTVGISLVFLTAKYTGALSEDCLIYLFSVVGMGICPVCPFSGLLDALLSTDVSKRV